VDADRLGDLLADRVDRIETGQRLLEDHADIVAADATHGLWRERLQRNDLARFAPEPDLTLCDAADPPGEEAHHREAGDGLARS
jgi:hypothetical protein